MNETNKYNLKDCKRLPCSCPGVKNTHCMTERSKESWNYNSFTCVTPARMGASLQTLESANTVSFLALLANSTPQEEEEDKF